MASKATWTIRTRRLMYDEKLSDQVAKKFLAEEHRKRHKPAALAYLNDIIRDWTEASKPTFKYVARPSEKKGGGVFLYIYATGTDLQKLRWEQIDKGAPGGENIVRKVFLSSSHGIYQPVKGQYSSTTKKGKTRRGRPSSFEGVKQVVRGRPTGPMKSQVPYLAWNYYEPSSNGRPGYFTGELRIRRTAPYTDYELHRDKRRAARTPPAPITRGPVRARRYSEKLTAVYLGTTTGQEGLLKNSALVGRNIARSALTKYFQAIKESKLVEVK